MIKKSTVYIIILAFLNLMLMSGTAYGSHCFSTGGSPGAYDPCAHQSTSTKETIIILGGTAIALGLVLWFVFSQISSQKKLTDSSPLINYENFDPKLPTGSREKETYILGEMIIYRW